MGGSVVYAVGCGSIELAMSNGHRVTLFEVLYVPASDVRLVSVQALNASGNYVSHFDASSFWVTNNSNTVVARGHVLPSRNVYTFPSHVSRPYSLSSFPSAHLARRVPDDESWHHRRY